LRQVGEAAQRRMDHWSPDNNIDGFFASIAKAAGRRREPVIAESL